MITAGVQAVAQPSDPPIALWEHIAELRRRLFHALIALGAVSAAAYPFTGWLIDQLASSAGDLVFTRPMEAFNARLEFSFYIGFAVTFPWVLIQAWEFIRPALGPKAGGFLRKLIPASYLLFLAGGALALFVVLPPATSFFLTFGTAHVRPMISLGDYVDFALRLFLSFGGAFQTPLIMCVITHLGLVSVTTLRNWRRGVYFSAFAIGALFTSPEVITQICLAVPLIVLYEVGLLLSTDPLN